MISMVDDPRMRKLDLVSSVIDKFLGENCGPFLSKIVAKKNKSYQPKKILKAFQKKIAAS